MFIIEFIFDIIVTFVIYVVLHDTGYYAIKTITFGYYPPVNTRNHKYRDAYMEVSLVCILLGTAIWGTVIYFIINEFF